MSHINNCFHIKQHIRSTNDIADIITNITFNNGQFHCDFDLTSLIILETEFFSNFISSDTIDFDNVSRIIFDDIYNIDVVIHLCKIILNTLKNIRTIKFNCFDYNYFEYNELNLYKLFVELFSIRENNINISNIHFNYINFYNIYVNWLICDEQYINIMKNNITTLYFKFDNHNIINVDNKLIKTFCNSLSTFNNLEALYIFGDFDIFYVSNSFSNFLFDSIINNISNFKDLKFLELYNIFYIESEYDFNMLEKIILFPNNLTINYMFDFIHVDFHDRLREIISLNNILISN